MLPQKTTPLPMDPDSPLNRAHQYERKAERMLNIGHYEKALQCYKDASDYICKAMENTTDSMVLLSLTLQRENYDKMPNLVHMRKQHDQLKSNLASIHLVEDSQEMETGETNGDSVVHNDVVDGDDSIVESVEPLKSLVPVLSEKICLDIEVKDGRTDSFESLPSTASEDTDSLLQCLNEHSKEHREERRIFYNPAQVLRALNRRILSSQTAELKGSDVDGIQDRQEKSGRKMEKDDRMRLEELNVKNADLRTHIMNLLEQLESCETENQRLKDTVRTLEQQLATHKSQDLVTQPGGFRDEFSVPFSLSAPTVGRTTPKESRILIPQTPPALSPIEMPNFDDQ